MYRSTHEGELTTNKNSFLRSAMFKGALLVGSLGVAASCGESKTSAQESEDVQTKTTIEEVVQATPDLQTSELTSFDFTIIGQYDGQASARRPNGDYLSVPMLRDPDGDPGEYAVSVSGLMACYMTTGGQECMDELTDDPETIETLKSLREYFSGGYIGEDMDKLQTVFVSNPDSLVEFSKSGDKISMTGGALNLELSKEDEWQTTPRQNGISLTIFEHVVDEFSFEIDDSGDSSKIHSLVFEVSRK